MEFLGNACWGFFFLFWLWIFLGWGLPAIIKSLEESAKARALKKAEEEDARFQREHPDAWRAKEMVKLERERLAAEKQFAENRQKHENVRQGAGAIAAIGRGLGWW